MAATSRTVESLISSIGETSENFLPLGANITDNNDIKSAIDKTVEHFGKIDVVVNNAGYGQIGTLEELTDEEARENYAVNVFGTLNVIRNAMPYLREQRSGNIFNISSVGGYSANFPGWEFTAQQICRCRIYGSIGRRSKGFRNSCHSCLSWIFPYRFLTKKIL